MITPSKGLLVGFLAGLATAILGAYKDTTFEEFNKRTFWRSPIIAALYGALGASLFPENESKLLLATFASTSERITVETWKAVTNQPPAKFSWGSELDKGWFWKKHGIEQQERVETNPTENLALCWH